MKMHNSKGFTLVEMMVALGLTGIISVALMTNMKNVSTSQRQTNQENIITATTKSVQTILTKAQTTNGNARSCEAVLTPGGVLAGALTPADFSINQDLGDGVRIESINITQEPSVEDRIPITVSLNFSKKVFGLETNVTRKVQTSVVNDGGTYKCINYDGDRIQSTSLDSSCAVIDTNGDCTFADFTNEFKLSLNRIICQTLGATNPIFAGNTICDQVYIERNLHGKNVSLSGNTILTEDQVCVGAQCRKVFDNSPCPANQYNDSMSVDGKIKGCKGLTFNYIAPPVIPTTNTCSAGTYSGCTLPASAGSTTGVSGTCSASPSNSCSADCNAAGNWTSFNTTACVVVPVINGSCDNTINNSCVSGSLNDTPDDASNYLWQCNGSGGGSSANCSKPKAAVVNGSCNNLVNNGCNTGTLFDTADSSSNYLWQCMGSGGGTTSSCSRAKPAVVNGSCNNTINNGCTAGSLNNTPDNASNYLWQCTGSGGGSTASCSKSKTPVVNGACNNSTNNACTSGTLNDTADNATTFLWQCTGSGGGSNASCSKAKSCSWSRVMYTGSKCPGSGCGVPFCSTATCDSSGNKNFNTWCRIDGFFGPDAESRPWGCVQTCN